MISVNAIINSLSSMLTNLPPCSRFESYNALGTSNCAGYGELEFRTLKPRVSAKG